MCGIAQCTANLHIVGAIFPLWGEGEVEVEEARAADVGSPNNINRDSLLPVPEEWGGGGGDYLGEDPLFQSYTSDPPLLGEQQRMYDDVVVLEGGEEITEVSAVLYLLSYY